VALHRSSSGGERGWIARKGECDGDGHVSPCGRRAGTRGYPSLLEHALQTSATTARQGRRGPYHDHRPAVLRKAHFVELGEGPREPPPEATTVGR
jgi:hypothetical protein